MSKPNNQMFGIKRNPFSNKKHRNKTKRKHRKTQDHIKKLFDKLRNESNITLNSTQDDIDPENNSTVVVFDDTIRQSPNKRKLSDTSIGEGMPAKKLNIYVDTIIIPDDTVIEENAAPCNSVFKNEKQTLESIILNEYELQTNNSACSSSKKNKVSVSDSNLQTQEKTNDALLNSEPCNAKTPRKRGIAPPMNSSTPITKSNTNIVRSNNADSTKTHTVDLEETKVINRDSFLTIDLTAESEASRLQGNTVIDLDNTQETEDCTFVSMSNASSMSGDSQVTVLRRNSNSSSSKRMDKFVSGIAKLDASEKGRLLELITQKIFSGCKVPERLNGNTSNAVGTAKQVIETAETTYIKEIILGEKKSRNSIGSNIYNPEKDLRNQTGLRMVVIDGSNVAMEHGRGRVFSVRGLKICIDYFLKRGHTVKAFVPRFRCKFGKSSDPRLLDDLEKRSFVVYTPSREIQGKRIASYDDRYIVQCAAEFDGVIVSGDNYRDLLQENPRWRFVIENRILPFTWVDDMIMFPRDPLGRNGPTLEQFLRHPPKSN